MIKVINLTYNFDTRFSALYNFSFNFLDNKNYLLISHQELESQTLLRILSKQYKNYQGEVFFNDENLKAINIKNLDVSYITKTPYLIKNKSAEFNVAYPLIVRKEKKEIAKKKARDLIKKFGYENLTNLKVKELSENECIVISILRALIRKPKYIFSDDIFFNSELIKLLPAIKENSNCIFAIKDINLKEKFNDFETITF